MDKIKQTIADAYDEALDAGTGDEGGTAPAWSGHATEIILKALDKAGFEIVAKAAHGQGAGETK